MKDVKKAGKLWTRDFVTAALMNFSLCMVFYLLMAVTAAYAVDRFGTSTGVAGLVSGIFIIGILVGRLGAGRVIGRIGSRRVMIIGALAFVCTSLLYFAAVSLPLLVAVRLLHGIAFGITSNATITIAAHIIPPHRRGEGIGYYSMSTIVAAALGPFAGLLLMQHTGFPTIFTVTSILPVVSLIIASIIREPASSPPPSEAEPGKGGFRLSNYIDYTALPISIIILVIGASYSVLLIFLSLYTRHIGLTEVASFFFPLYAATVLVTRPFSGRLLDARGANAVVYPCLSIFAIGMLLFSRAGSGLTLLIAGVVIGFGYGNFLSCAQAISIKGVPPHRLGLATSTYFICMDLGFGVGPYILGSLVPVTGYRGLYLTMVGIIIATMGLYHVLHGRKERPQAIR